MTRWAIGGVVLLAGLAALVCVGRARTGPEAVVNAPVEPQPAPPVPPRPAEPAPDRVVDVTDIDPLLDPPATHAATGPAAPVLTAVGYEEPVPTPPPASPVTPIPPAVEDEPAAAESPLARLSLRPPLVDVGDFMMEIRVPPGLGELPVRAVRAGWYGDECSLMEGKVVDFWAEWSLSPPRVVNPQPSYQIETGYVRDGGLFF